MRKAISFGMFLSAICYLPAAICFAGGVGTTGAQFLKLGVGAKPAAMGEAFVGLADDVNAIFWNPAGLNQLTGREITAMHTLWFEDIFFSNFAYCQRALGGNIGGGVNFLSAGKIDKYDRDGNKLDETYTPTDLALILSYARRIKNIPLGVNFKVISSRIEEESATGFGIDLGAMHELKIRNQKLQIGLVIQNAGMGLRFNKERDALPLNVKLGFCYRLLNDKLTLALDGNFPLDYTINGHFGVEYMCKFGSVSLLPRIGCKTTTIKDLDALSGLSAGFGFHYKTYGVDYAWVPYWQFGDTHRLSLCLRF